MSSAPSKESIFHAAVEIADPRARQAYLDGACSGDAALRREVEELLASDAVASGFLSGAGLGPEPTADFQPPLERPGTPIGHYRLMEQIGEGGFGLVFVAEQLHPVRRKVALKVIRPGMDTRDVIARFEAERQALALMDHPNIAKVLDAGATDSGRPYFVMELVRGIPITNYCDQNQLTPRERLALFVPVCQAVQHAHQKGIIHRDIKPSNVLVTLHDGQPVVKVIDFGISKALNQQLTEKTIYTRFAQMIGTPLYMSPEQAEMSGLDIDTRSDIYSLGVLLYELLTGTTPFDHQRLAKAAFDEIRRIIREEEPPKPSTRVTQQTDSLPSIAAQRKTEPAKLSRLIRGDLDWIVMKALEKDRTRRYDSASGLAKDVDRYLRDEPVEATPPTAGYLFRKWARKRRPQLIVSAICSLAIAIGITGLVQGYFRSRAAARVAKAERDRAVESGKRAKASEIKARRQEKAAKESAAKAIEQEKKAKQHAQETDALSAMFQRLCEDAAGKVRDGETWRDRTFLEALQNAEAAIEAQFQDQPAAEARFRNFLANYYLDRDDLERATANYERAVALSEKANGPAHPATLSWVANLSTAYAVADAEKGIQFLRKWIDKSTAAFGADHQNTLDLQIALGRMYANANQPERALEVQEWVYRVTKERHPSNSAYRAAAAWNLAHALSSAGRHAEAVPLLEELLHAAPDGVFKSEGFELQLPDLDEEIADEYVKLEKFAEAAQQYRKLIARKKEKLGEDHPDLKDWLVTLADLDAKTKDFDAAERTWRQIIQVARAASKDNFYDLTRMQVHFAKMLFERGKHKEAEAVLNEMLPLATEHKYGDPVKEGRLLLGEVLLAQNRYGEAEPLLKEAYENYKDALIFNFDGEHAEFRPIQPRDRAIDALVALYERSGKPEEAEKWKATPKAPRPNPKKNEEKGE